MSFLFFSYVLRMLMKLQNVMFLCPGHFLCSPNTGISWAMLWL
jgi:hypothetical protein